MQTQSISSTDGVHRTLGDPPSKNRCLPVALIIITALGLFLLLANYEIFPSSHNIISDLGSFGEALGYIALITGGLFLYLFYKCREGQGELAEGQRELEVKKLELHNTIVAFTDQTQAIQSEDALIAAHCPKNSLGQPVTNFLSLQSEISSLECAVLQLKSKLHLEMLCIEKGVVLGGVKTLPKDPAGEVEEYAKRFNSLCQIGRCTITPINPSLPPRVIRNLKPDNASAQRINEQLDRLEDSLKTTKELLGKIKAAQVSSEGVS